MQIALKPMCRATVALILVLYSASFAGPAATAELENSGPNVNLIRRANGRYIYRNLTNGRQRGEERFQLLVHSDGSRTLMIWHDLWAKNAQFTVVLRVAENFRPLTAFVSYWVASGYKGNATFQVRGNQLTANGVGLAGLTQQRLVVPEHFSIGAHPVAADGWHLWYAPETAGPAEGSINLFSVEATADLEKPVLGQLVEMPYTKLGRETIETPAGQFETMHYRLMGASDLWVAGPDRLLVRMIQPRFDREYLLVELSGTVP